MICNTSYIYNYFCSQDYTKFQKKNKINLFTFFLKSIIEENNYIKIEYKNIYLNLIPFNNISEIINEIHKELSTNDNSIISENVFMEYKEEIICEKCINQTKNEKLKFLHFNIGIINEYFKLKQCTFYNCFEFYFPPEGRTIECGSCRGKAQLKQNLLSSPNILIILLDNNKNNNYYIEKEILINNNNKRIYSLLFYIKIMELKNLFFLF